MRFFEYVQNANMERLHSEVIAWLFSNDCIALLPDAKAKILSRIIGEEKEYRVKEVHTEKEDIDILIICNDKTLIAIENKVKISEHDDQLNKYEKKIVKDYPEYEALYLYLSLIGESSISRKWLTVSYLQLYKYLSNVNSEIEKNTDGAILLEYIDNLGLLTRCYSDFISDPTAFSSVFFGGAKKKHLKAMVQYNNQTERYIAMNNLETIFQKALFMEILEFIQPKCENKEVSETRGNALIDIKNPAGLKKIQHTEIGITFGIQFQNGGVKIQFENPLNKGHEQTIQLVKQISEKAKEFLANKKPKWEFNPAKSDSSPYCSFSQPVLGNKNKDVFMVGGKQALLKAFSDKYDEVLELAFELCEYLA